MTDYVGRGFDGPPLWGPQRRPAAELPLCAFRNKSALRACRKAGGRAEAPPHQMAPGQWT